MALPNAQPTLPAETPLSDMEQFFLGDQPKRLWPKNQNSNLGFVRKLATDPMQEAIDELTEIVNEMFLDTASGFLGLWEDQLGLPRAPSGLTVEQRRNLLLVASAKQPFTRTRRREIVEAFISTTFGPATQLTGAGIPLTVGGVTLYSGASSAAGLYSITENVEDFGYTVSIDSSVGVNILVLTRELERITPAGIHFLIVTTVGGGIPDPATYGSGTYGTGTYGG